MYNESVKIKFIQQYTNSEKTADICLSVFNNFEESENIWNADLCTRTTEELQPIVDKYTGLRKSSQRTKLIILRDYVKWCISSGIPGACDGMLKIQEAGVSIIRRQTLASPMHLQHYLNCICEPEIEETTDNIYRCFYWLAYSGIKEEDILNIKCSDIDFNNMVIKYNNENYILFRESLTAFKNCVNLNSFVYKHPNYQKRLPRATGDTLIRGIRSTTTIKSMRVELSRRSKKCLESGKTDLKLSYYRVWLSGIFYKMYYEREQIKIDVDFRYYAEQFVADKTYKLETGRNLIESKINQVSKDYMDDYIRWKQAYNL